MTSPEIIALRRQVVDLEAKVERLERIVDECLLSVSRTLPLVPVAPIVPASVVLARHLEPAEARPAHNEPRTLQERRRDTHRAYASNLQ